MEEDIIYNDVVKIERADDNTLQKLKQSQEEQELKRKKREQDPFADFDFGDDY